MATPHDFADVFDQLERDKVRYVVVSGVAVVLHGSVRPIVDLDLVIDGEPNEAHRAMLALATTGFVPSIPLPLSMLTVLRMFDSLGREVDVFVRYQIPFEELWRDSQRMAVGDSTARVASVEHVIRAKRVVGRPHDLLDIEGLAKVATQTGSVAVAGAPPSPVELSEMPPHHSLETSEAPAPSRPVQSMETDLL
ncbi:MAG: hypothetical protein AABP62_15515 [Planctomycetota bacterium]